MRLISNAYIPRLKIPLDTHDISICFHADDPRNRQSMNQPP